MSKSNSFVRFSSPSPQEAKAKVTDADVDAFFSTSQRSLDDLFGHKAAAAPASPADQEKKAESEDESKLSKAEKRALKKQAGLEYQQKMGILSKKGADAAVDGEPDAS